MIRLLLCKNPNERPTAFEAKSHSYIQSMVKSMNAAHNPTVSYKFEPNNGMIQDIINSLNTSVNIKNEIFSLLLSHFEISEAEMCVVRKN